MKVLGKSCRTVFVAAQGFTKLPSKPSGNQMRILASFDLFTVSGAFIVANRNAGTTGQCHDAILESVDALYRAAREITGRLLDLQSGNLKRPASRRTKGPRAIPLLRAQLVEPPERRTNILTLFRTRVDVLELTH